jgi:GNAT superfamily N-acetyltransferase
MNIIVRNIKVSDYPQVSKLIIKTHKISFGEIYPEQLVNAFCEKYSVEKLAEKAKEIEYWVAEDRDSKEVRGIIGLKDNELRTFFVDPDYQGKGIGKKLYVNLEQIAKDREIQKIVLVGSPLGQPVYKKFGFIKTGELHKEKVGISYTDAVMEKVLM